MRRFTIMFVVLAWLSVPLHVHAKELGFDGNALLQDCTAELGTFSNGACFGLILGMGKMNQLVPSNSPAYLCLPEGVIVEQRRKIVIKYLQDHPAKLHLPMEALVILALGEAFPCEAQLSPQ